MKIYKANSDKFKICFKIVVCLNFLITLLSSSFVASSANVGATPRNNHNPSMSSMLSSFNKCFLAIESTDNTSRRSSILEGSTVSQTVESSLEETTFNEANIQALNLDSLGPYGNVTSFATTVVSSRHPEIGWAFQMRIFFPQGKEGCMSTLGLIHSVDLYKASSNSESADLCNLIASHGFICFYTDENVKQFERLNTYLVDGLSHRIKDMWYTLLMMENNDSSSPLYMSVCDSIGLVGYGLGAAAVTKYAALRSDSGLKFVAPLHPTQTRLISSLTPLVSVPICSGTTNEDTVAPTTILSSMWDSAKAPTIVVILEGK